MQFDLFEIKHQCCLSKYTDSNALKFKKKKRIGGGWGWGGGGNFFDKMGGVVNRWWLFFKKGSFTYFHTN